MRIDADVPPPFVKIVFVLAYPEGWQAVFVCFHPDVVPALMPCVTFTRFLGHSPCRRAFVTALAKV